MKRAMRLAVVVVVLAAMSYATWRIHLGYWRRQGSRTITPGRLYVLTDADETLLGRLRAHYGTLSLVDLRPDAEVAPPPSPDREQFTRIHPMPMPYGAVPEPEQVKAFLNLAARTEHPLVLAPGKPPTASRDLRVDCLETAYRHLVRGEPLEQALRQTGVAGTPHEAPVRQLIRSVSGP